MGVQNSLDTKIYQKCNHKRFYTASMAWLEFILSNRGSKYSTHQYDIVSGPTADDGVGLVLSSYIAGAYGEVGSTNAKQLAITLLKTDKLSKQIFFGNNGIVQYLNLIDRGEYR